MQCFYVYINSAEGRHKICEVGPAFLRTSHPLPRMPFDLSQCKDAKVGVKSRHAF